MYLKVCLVKINNFLIECESDFSGRFPYFYFKSVVWAIYVIAMLPKRVKEFLKSILMNIFHVIILTNPTNDRVRNNIIGFVIKAVVVYMRLRSFLTYWLRVYYTLGSEFMTNTVNWRYNILLHTTVFTTHPTNWSDNYIKQRTITVLRFQSEIL